MNLPWGDLRVSDAHVHFFSARFFDTLGARGKLDWQMPPEDPADLASDWVAELDRHGVARASLIASVAGDEASVLAAVHRYPDRFYAYAMTNPLAAKSVPEGINAVCFFPAMHRYSMHHERVQPFLRPHSVVFVHCGVLTVGIRKKLGLPSPFDMRYSNPIDLHAIALEHPQVTFVVPHFGAGYFREALMLCDLCPNVYLDTSSTNSWMRYEGLDLTTVFRRALDVAGPKRLLFGSDSSFFPRGWNAQIVQTQADILYKLGVSAEDAALIFGGNLERIFARPAH